MNTKTQESLQRVIEMYLADEEHHFMETGYPKDHIYRDLLSLQSYLTDEAESRESHQAKCIAAIARANSEVTEIRNRRT